MSMRRIINGIAATALLISSSSVIADALDAIVKWSIQPQDVASALLAFSDSTKLQVVSVGSEVRGLRSPGVEGELSAQEALARLLRGTGLQFEVIDEQTIRIFTSSARGYKAPEREVMASASGGTAAQEAYTRTGAGELLHEIVVSARRATTATKTDAALTETPQAISVITADQFLDQGALSFEDTLRYSSGVTGETFGLDSRNANVVIRGMDAVEYLDGMRRIFGFLNSARTDVYTLERVEILRGPSSMLYGAGSAGGLVNQTSKRPRFEQAGEVGLQYGSYDRTQVQFDLTGPLGSSETFAGRVVGVAREADTQVDFVPDDRLLLMPSLTWRLSDDTDMTLLAQWRKDRLDQTAQYPPLVATLQAPQGRRIPDSFFGGEPGYNRYDVDQQDATLLIEHRYSDAIRYSAGMRYTYSRTATDNIYVNSFSSPTDPFIDADDEVMPREYDDSIRRAKVFTTDQRLEIGFDTGPFTHRVLVGADYQAFRQVRDRRTGTAPPLNIYHPVYGDTPLQDPMTRRPTVRESQIGFYVQDQTDYADRLHVVLGARRDRARSHSEGADEQVDNATTFRAAFIVDVWNGLSPYVSYAESFLPVAGAGASGQTFVPQEGMQYEVGIKWQPAPATLLTLAAFDLRDTNRLTNHPTDVTLTVQQGEVKSRGIEIEASHTFFDSFNLIANFTDMDAEISKSNTPAEIGLPLDAVPERTASAWGVKRFDIGADTIFRVGAGVRYMGESLSSGTLEIPSYTLVDALVELEKEQWSLSINATNLTDKRHYSTCLTRGDCWIGARRYVVGALNYRF
jgi:iron complex outermembrane recepter protein